MASKKSWLPREGFHFDVLATVFKQTLLNPVLTLPLWLLTRYTHSGEAFALDNPKTVQRLTTLLCLGVARYANGALSRGAQNNWTSAKPDWKRELVLITGGSDGIGKLLVKLFAARGVKVVILDIQEPTFELPTNVFFVKSDLTDNDSLVAACNLVKQQYGNPSVLVLNAGIINRHSILNLPDNLLQRVFALNTLSHYRLIRELLPAMVRANHGMVCTTSSLAGFVTCPGMVDYDSTKSSVIAFHEGLSVELVTRYNAPAIRTILICPNFTHTKLSEGFQNESAFINPTLDANTVAELEFDKIWQWESGVHSLPTYQSAVAMNFRSWPYWLQIPFRNGLKRVMLGVETAEQERLKRLNEKREAEVGESIIQVESDIPDGTKMFA